MQTGNTDFIYKNELDKACFQHMVYGKSKVLIKRTQSDKVLKGKAFKIGNNPNYDGYQRGLASIVYKFFDKMSVLLYKSKGSGIINEPNYQLTNNFINQLLENFKKEKLIHHIEIIFGVLIKLICSH